MVEKKLDVLAGLKSRLADIYGEDAAKLYLGSFHVKVIHLYGSAYRVNFWSGSRVEHSFFIKWTEQEGITYINPEISMEFNYGHDETTAANPAKSSTLSI